MKLMEDRYAKEGEERQTDEFMKPIVVGPDFEEGKLKDGDTLVLFNYR